jgi:two-component sensor histidine kinase
MTPSYSPASASALRAPLVGTAVIVLLTAAFLTLQFTSLRPGLVERDIATAGRRLSDLVSEGEGYFEEISALTAQLPSRTAIRDALARSLAGQETPEAVTAFTTPRIGDAVEASALLLGVVRIDREETIVARYGTVLPDDAASRAAIAAGNAATVLPGYFEIGDHRTIQIVQPIVHGTGELLGWDVVSVAAAPLLRMIATVDERYPAASLTWLARGVGESGDNSERVSAEWQPVAGRPTAATPTTTDAAVRGAEMITVGRDVSSANRLVATVPREIVLEAATRQTRYTAYTVVLLAAVAVIVNGLLIRRLLADSRAQTEYLETTVAERTRELEALVTAKSVLVQEAHHRVKNDLMLAKAMVSLQRARVDDPSTADRLEDTENRLTSMGSVYSSLLDQESGSLVALRPIIERLATALLSDWPAPAAGDHVFTIADVMVSPTVSVRLGIILNELITNAMKYARREGDTPRLDIQLEDATDHHFTLVVHDNGPGAPDAVISGPIRGFGLQMVEELAAQYGGELVLRNDGGLRAEVRIRRERL